MPCCFEPGVTQSTPGESCDRSDCSSHHNRKQTGGRGTIPTLFQRYTSNDLIVTPPNRATGWWPSICRMRIWETFWIQTLAVTGKIQYRYPFVSQRRWETSWDVYEQGGLWDTYSKGQWSPYNRVRISIWNCVGLLTCKLFTLYLPSFIEQEKVYVCITVWLWPKPAGDIK